LEFAMIDHPVLSDGQRTSPQAITARRPEIGDAASDWIFALGQPLKEVGV